MQREALAWRKKGLRIGFVPTMGALHEGHLSLVRLARKKADRVVVSLYVNPTQFGPKEDFGRYPRPRTEDLRLCREAGVDVVFAPESLYHPDASTWVEETVLSRGRCGESRPGHFRGVTTVVMKLLQIVQPDVVVFGQKDAQQCDVLERMVRDLYVPVRMVRAPLVRDGRGVALSSRNRYLSPDEYERAVAFARALRESRTVREARRKLAGIAGVEIDYVERVGDRLCAAVRVGKTRLIDNVAIRPGTR
jgi:pantoate--beta-alanine ligase